jgi:hypothetical protein
VTSPQRHVEVFRGRDVIRTGPYGPRPVRQWFFRVVSRNGEIMAPSQGYTRRWNAKRAARELHPFLPIRRGRRDR